MAAKTTGAPLPMATRPCYERSARHDFATASVLRIAVVELAAVALALFAAAAWMFFARRGR